MTEHTVLSADDVLNAAGGAGAAAVSDPAAGEAAGYGRGYGLAQAGQQCPSPSSAAPSRPCPHLCPIVQSAVGLAAAWGTDSGPAAVQELANAKKRGDEYESKLVASKAEVAGMTEELAVEQKRSWMAERKQKELHGLMRDKDAEWSMKMLGAMET